MNFKEDIFSYVPKNEQEIQDKKVIIDYINQFPDNILLRDNEFAHITSSGFIMNRELSKVLMIHHNIRNAWAWTGGHADGDGDLLHVAIKEAKEETGISSVFALSKEIASLDILPVYGHVKKGKYVSGHLHLSVAYILIADEKENLVIKEDENSGVEWFPVDKFTVQYFSENDVYLYNKLIEAAKEMSKNKI
ncbi:NUDIX hydrolase [Clostridium manihotivorum]|uniref:NUDIX hydrolase n=1 Tax=Clostridium manihotivorum TaxID=2320868 RepID=A0A3R5U5T6_9CLOT|nr:NUDIX hydrolase [Clostridium manihotivorum]QAA32544.1 NUDIX hydrolase [Clostridium manihotivorum]